MTASRDNNQRRSRPSFSGQQQAADLTDNQDRGGTAQNRTASQIEACVRTLRVMLHASIVSNAPIDRVMAAYFKRNRQYGSRDKRLIREIIFSSFRWLGWLRPMVDKAFNKALQDSQGAYKPDQDAPDPELPLNEPSCCLVILGSIMLEQTLYDSAAADLVQPLARKVNLPANGTNSCQYGSWQKRLKEFSKLTGHSDLADQPISALIPKWALNHIALSDTETEKLVRWLQTRPPLWVRAQGASVKNLTRQFRKAGYHTAASPLLPGALRIDNPDGNFSKTEPFTKGFCEVQDFGSQVIGRTCAPKAGERWWDACAGAGGKSLQLANLMGGKGVVVASDVREYKLKDLKQRIKRGGFSNIMPKPWDGGSIDTKRFSFDGVLVDAPCSCSGTWRRNPDARWSTRESEVAQLTEVQLDILNKVAGTVKPGGILVYATCSMFKKENTGVVTSFLKAHEEFELASFKNPLTSDEVTDGTLQVWPWDGDCDALFVTRMQRKPNDESSA